MPTTSTPKNDCFLFSSNHALCLSLDEFMPKNDKAAKVEVPEGSCYYRTARAHG